MSSLAEVEEVSGDNSALSDVANRANNYRCTSWDHSRIALVFLEEIRMENGHFRFFFLHVGSISLNLITLVTYGPRSVVLAPAEGLGQYMFNNVRPSLDIQKYFFLPVSRKIQNIMVSLFAKKGLK